MEMTTRMYKFYYNITVDLIISGDVLCVVTGAKNVVKRTAVSFSDTSECFIVQRDG
ncbi:MAG: hypothetical protein P8Y18_01875 [Candidatus Bathyarchaeota archaeon]